MPIIAPEPRLQTMPSAVVAFGDFELDESRFELRRLGELVAIQRRVFDLLVFLVKTRDRVATREEIFASVWPGVVVTSAALGQAVMEARRVLGSSGEEWIQTVRGRGFRFMAPVTERKAADPISSARIARRDAMVGRSAVWQVVGDALAAVQIGRGSVLVVTGDDGSGKTHLIEETRALAQGQGIHASVAVLDASQGNDGRGDAGWRSLLAPSAIETLALSGPLLVALDDVHLASQEGLALADTLARLSRRASVCVLLTAANYSLETGTAFPVLNRIARDGTVVRLKRLTVDEIVELVRTHAGRSLGASEAAALHMATGGNPRLVLQLVRSGLEASGALRPGATMGSSADALKSVRRSALARVEALTPATLRVMSAAAVLGRDLDVARIAELLEEEPSHVFRAMDEALIANLVRRRTEAAGSYRFAIGLVRDGLYDSLPEESRARFHHGAARLPATGTSADALLERARHAIRAGLFMDDDERAEIVSQAAHALLAKERREEAAQIVRGALNAELRRDASPRDERVALKALLADALAPSTPASNPVPKP